MSRLRDNQSAPNCFGMSTKCIPDRIVNFLKFSRFSICFFQYFSRFSICFFKYFLSSFFRIKSKNIVCETSTKTSKYWPDVSQRYVQCFTSFFLSLLSKKWAYIFFSKFFDFFRKILFSSLNRNLGKHALRSLEMQQSVL
jgi:hypothetical protein